jgi:hypothetical protein
VDRHLSSSGVSKIADETAMLPFVSLDFAGMPSFLHPCGLYLIYYTLLVSFPILVGIFYVYGSLNSVFICCLVSILLVVYYFLLCIMPITIGHVGAQMKDMAPKIGLVNESIVVL